MYSFNNQLIYSPSDLCTFMESPFASWMDRYSMLDKDARSLQDEQDPVMSLLAQKGIAHELQVLERFKSNRYSVAEIEQGPHEQQLNDTIEAMQSGADVIFQAYLELAPFRGYADFLVKVDGNSNLGGYHYEVWDGKLAKHVKPYFVIQLCCYAEMLEAVQGICPNSMVIAMGDGSNERLIVSDYYSYYLALKSRFLAAVSDFDLASMPDPYESRGWGRWSDYAASILEEKDHLSRVATISRTQVKHLQSHGVDTMRALAELEIQHVPGIAPSVLQRLINQAAIQIRSQHTSKPEYQVLPHEEGKSFGLAMLPPHSDLDIFFDIEGYPLMDGGLEYLWGATYFDKTGKRQFKDFWAHDRAQEKEAFEQFIRWAYDRWQQDPSMHIYHYANYEIAACRKLMGRFGVCEYEVDQLLRNNVFVDLYVVVKHAMLIGEPRYSIKNVEHLYRGSRETEVANGAESVVVYESWREQPDGDDWKSSKILKEIRDYNIDDCDSTQELVEWLRDRQKESGISWIGNAEVEEQELSEEISDKISLREQLLKESSEEGDLYETLAWSLDFHRREAKPTWWRLFDRLGMLEDELLHDPDALAGCERTTDEPYKPTPRARNLAFTYCFDRNQDFRHASLNSVYVVGEDNYKLTVADLDLERGIIAFSAKEEPPARISIVPDEYIRPDPIPGSIEQVCRTIQEKPVSYPALQDLLMGGIPRIIDHELGTPIVKAKEPQERLNQLIKAVCNLDNSYLTIQGPPGTGKTFSGKHIISELLRQGKRIGISSNSHKAIDNLLIGASKQVIEDGVSARFIKSKATDERFEELGIEVIANGGIADCIEDAIVVGTTAWGFARDDLADQFDYLFIDEAGQVSVSNLIGMGRCAKNIVLMGDQMQLPQPAQGDHPGKSGLSILDYLMGEESTVSDKMGVFLDTTYRMHSSVNQFISDGIYDGRLHSAPENDLQVVRLPEEGGELITKDSGICYLSIEHDGNTQASVEEIEVIKEIISEVLGRTYVDKENGERAVTLQDVLVVAPYNHQVNLLKQALGDKAKIGTVDKFQGQEAPIVILSMCASNAADSSRGIDFLLNKHRLNVAISRAQALAVVVAGEQLVDQVGGTLQAIKLANLFVKLRRCA